MHVVPVGGARTELGAAMGHEEAHFVALVALCRPAPTRGVVRYSAPGAP